MVIGNDGSLKKSNSYNKTLAIQCLIVRQCLHCTIVFFSIILSIMQVQVQIQVVLYISYKFGWLDTHNTKGT